MQIDFTVEGIRDLLGRFEKVERGVLDLRDLGAWDAVESQYRKVMADVFATEGGSTRSGKWKALTPKYAAVKARKYGNLPIMQATQRTYRSLAAKSGDSVVDKQAQEMTIGTSVPYAGYAVRVRPIHDLTDEQKRFIVKPVGDKLRQLIDNAKLRDVRGF
jgi:hypothetical protein